MVCGFLVALQLQSELHTCNGYYSPTLARWSSPGTPTSTLTADRWQHSEQKPWISMKGPADVTYVRRFHVKVDFYGESACVRVLSGFSHPVKGQLKRRDVYFYTPPQITSMYILYMQIISHYCIRIPLITLYC